MAFQTPIGVPLTETQENLLSQLSSLKGFLAIPDKKDRNVDKERQISTFDYLLRLTEATIGAAFVDVMLKTFISRLFDPSSDRLEKFVIKSMAASLKSSNKKISNTQTNEDWLNQNVLPGLRVTFLVAKAVIAKQIITMIFGPKDKMPVKNSAQDPDALLSSAVCSDTMFSVSNSSSETDGDIEFNTVELKKRLEKGEVIFTISCQDVKIKLPENIFSALDQVVDNNSNPSKPPTNPAVMFDVVANHVGTETQRINSPVNNNAIKKGFTQILVEKIINLITPALEPHLNTAFNKINSGPNGNIGVSAASMLCDPCTLRDSCGSNDASFKQKSAFTSTISNLIYAMVCAIILQQLIKQIKKLIANALARRAKNKLKRQLAKQRQRLEILDNAADAVSAVQKSRAALATMDDIFNFENKV